jgi:hypothetical protein
MIFAQALGEYGALAGIASVVESAYYRVHTVLREPRASVPVVLVAVVLLYFLLRRR